MGNRREFSRQTKRWAWERADGQCQGIIFEASDYKSTGHLWIWRHCKAPLDHGCFHYDHVIPTWTSGRNDLDNCQLLCVTCHKRKTLWDQRNIAKSKRIQDKRIKAKTSRNPLPGGRNSKFKKKLDGSVVLR